MSRDRSLVSRRQALAALTVAGLSAGAIHAAVSFSRVAADAKRRVSQGSEVMRTRFGTLEYAVAGDGPPLLMIHGTGGGFDQGLAVSSGLVRRGYKAIAPSRFGYLRSDFPAEASSENQADAFVDLLDHLGIEKVPVGGVSAGALSAAQFALRHPHRCSGLILLVPAANVHGRDPVRMSPWQQWMVERLVTSDLLFWSALNVSPDLLVRELLATDPRLLDLGGPGERARAYRILEEIMPVGPRARGMLNDARLAGSPARMDFARLAVPTLVISVEDDRFGTASTARDIAGAVSGARLVIYPSGGHIWVGHDDEVSDEMAKFLRELGRSRAVSQVS